MNSNKKPIIATPVSPTDNIQKPIIARPVSENENAPDAPDAPENNEEKKSPKEITDILKVLVDSIGKDSPNSLEAQQNVRQLLKKYPNKVPEAIVQIIVSKLKKNGLGVIFIVQVMSTLLALLVGLIPIPGVAVIADMIIGGTDAFIDSMVALGPENITDLLSNGVQKALDSFKNDFLPIFKETSEMMSGSLSGVFCCSKSQQNQASQNMDKYGDVLVQLIKLINQGPEKNAAVESFIEQLQNNVIKTKTVNSVDMKALDKLLNQSSESKSSTNEANFPETTTETKKQKMEGGKKKKKRKTRKNKRKSKRKTKSKRR